MARVTVHMQDDSGNSRGVLVTDPDATDSVASSTGLFHIRVNADDNDNDNDGAQLLIPTNALSQIGYRAGSTSGGALAVRGLTQGYQDRRGQDGGV